MASALAGCGLEFAADSGAGRHLVSSQALVSQGVSSELIGECMQFASHPLKFHTGGGSRHADRTVGLLSDSTFGLSNHYTCLMSVHSFGLSA